VLDFSCLKHVKTVTVQGRREVYNATCPGNTSTVYFVDVYFMYAWTGEKKLCIFAESFNAGEYVAGRRVSGSSSTTAAQLRGPPETSQPRDALG
jgi:hypothetical protein